MPDRPDFIFIHFHSCFFPPIAIEFLVESEKEAVFPPDFPFYPNRKFLI